MNGPVNPDTLPLLESAVHAPPGRYGLYRDAQGIVAIAVRPRAGRAVDVVVLPNGSLDGDKRSAS